MKPPRTTDDEPDTLIMDLNEDGEPVPFDSPQDAMRALVAIYGEMHPDQTIELHNAGCGGEPGCGCPILTVAELMPKVMA